MPGITFSHPQLEELKLDLDQALETALDFDFSYLRLAVYWLQVEQKRDQYNFATIQRILDRCQQAQQPVLMTLGLKAPRWPEFYWPPYLPNHDLTSTLNQQRLLKFIQATVENLQDYDCITHWQLENEPLDPSGPEQAVISLELLKNELQLLKELDERPVVLNLWANELLKRQHLQTLAPLADVIGLDLYPKVYLTSILGRALYQPPQQSTRHLRRALEKINQPIWLTELQAEPWEKNQASYLKDNPGSISPRQLKNNLRLAQKLPVTETLLWGFEYWLWRAKQGDDRYLKTVKNWLRQN